MKSRTGIGPRTNHPISRVQVPEITSSNPKNPKNAATAPFKTPAAPKGAKGVRLSEFHSENAVPVMNTTSSAWKRYDRRGIG